MGLTAGLGITEMVSCSVYGQACTSDDDACSSSVREKDAGDVEDAGDVGAHDGALFTDGSLNRGIGGAASQGGAGGTAGAEAGGSGGHNAGGDGGEGDGGALGGGRDQ